MSARYVHTNPQVADIVTKGSFQTATWNELMHVSGSVQNLSTAAHVSDVAALAPLAHKMAKRSRRSSDEISKACGQP